MARRVFRLQLFLLLSLSAVSAAHAVDMGIITGGAKGTYYQFGLNLKTLVAEQGINLTVVN